MPTNNINIAVIDIHEVHEIIDKTYGPSRAVHITQEKINQFAELTEDYQWIHTDPARAAQSTFGSTIVHGFYILSLIATFNMELIQISGTKSRVNYGLNKVRFPASVPVNASVRAFTKLKEAKSVRGGTQLIFELELHADNIDKPVCVAEFISLAPGVYVAGNVGIDGKD